jgi:hypothetical protein
VAGGDPWAWRRVVVGRLRRRRDSRRLFPGAGPPRTASYGSPRAASYGSDREHLTGLERGSRRLGRLGSLGRFGKLGRLERLLCEVHVDHGVVHHLYLDHAVPVALQAEDERQLLSGLLEQQVERRLAEPGVRIAPTEDVGAARVGPKRQVRSRRTAAGQRSDGGPGARRAVEQVRAGGDPEGGAGGQRCPCQRRDQEHREDQHQPPLMFCLPGRRRGRGFDQHVGCPLRAVSHADPLACRPWAKHQKTERPRKRVGSRRPSRSCASAVLSRSHGPPSLDHQREGDLRLASPGVDQRADKLGKGPLGQEPRREAAPTQSGQEQAPRRRVVGQGYEQEQAVSTLVSTASAGGSRWLRARSVDPARRWPGPSVRDRLES